MKSERTIEATIITKLFTLLKNSGKFKRVFKGEAIKGKGVGEVLEWSGVGTPWALTVRDLIVASDNFSKEPDGVLLLAIEIKYFPKGAASSRKQWQQNFREIGQPLRDLLYGFDAAVLWHLFSETVHDEDITKYSAMVSEVIEKLMLPVVYFATKFTAQSQFVFFRPWRSEKTLPLSSIDHLSECLLQIGREREGSYRERMNPLLADQKVIRMRAAVKSVLRIP